MHRKQQSIHIMYT